LEIQWRQICLQPEKIIAKFWGFYQIHELYQLIRTQKLNLFSLKQFNDKILNSGQVPIFTIRRCMLRRNKL